MSIIRMSPDGISGTEGVDVSEGVGEPLETLENVAVGITPFGG